MEIEVKKTYFGLQIRAWREENTNHPYPWSFEITDSEGKTKRYGGIPNMCETSAQALKRAWYRAKWISDGTIDQKYR